MPSMFNKEGVLHFNYKAEDLAPAETAARAQLEKDLADLIAIPADKRTFENTILGYEKAFDKYSEALGMSGFLQSHQRIYGHEPQAGPGGSKTC